MVDIGKYKKQIKIKQQNYDNSLSGCTGYCFIEGNKIIKIYNRSYALSEVDNMSSYSSSRISFPIEYIKRMNRYYGEIMPYYNVSNILESFKIKCDIDKLISNYFIIVNEMRKFPEIMMNDLSYPNILYDEEKGFYLIDITNWKIKKELKSFDLSKINIGELNDSIISCFSELVSGEWCEDMWFLKVLDEKKENLYLNYKSIRYYDFIKIMDLYREKILKRYNIDIKNIEDIKKSVKILKKY